jgi:hypothetical protein
MWVCYLNISYNVGMLPQHKLQCGYATSTESYNVGMLPQQKATITSFYLLSNSLFISRLTIRHYISQILTASLNETYINRITHNHLAICWRWFTVLRHNCTMCDDSNRFCFLRIYPRQLILQLDHFI